ncbi:Calnexin [Cryptotermes secundus]|uniref:Calnexin n=1 Tax=Cryptotermes secundus TaxID=105785 RepID=A0A2J7RG58_9NEOP|nr:calnexin [Cryptotermes secundus]XP_023701531.1 calnexin [Cryptotermes secundus]XP_023701532.1 calnexin [Cryptotermes secundus]PNF39812.1 Calnexin [Cryptotermes secundus]PNF39813.1 Calnexin [Cryptotermes secundus]
MKKRLLSFFIIGVVCLSLVTLSQSESEDEDDAVVTTEEDDVVVDDIIYRSPTPSGNVYFAEHFDDINQFNKKWTLSEAKKDDTDDDIAKYDGKWEVEAPQKNGLAGDLGLVLKSKAKHAAISARLDRPFKFTVKPLIVQYEVTLQEGQECGGAYLKLLTHGKHTADLRQFHDKTPYTIMFGPDKCGNDHKLHFIFRHKNPLNGTFSEKHCKKPKERLEEPFKDKLPHLYTLHVRPDNTFTVKLDHKVINEGNLLDDFTPPVNPPPEIDDPNDKKPADWDEREKIPDPEARKPDNWDEDAPAMIPDPTATKPESWLEDEPEMIPDPNAEKPDDWDADMDGDWEAPLIPNPACESAPGCGPWKPSLINNPDHKGKWRAPLIDNPNYKGKWKPQRIANPDFFEDKEPFRMADIAAVGLELWSMSNMILFDNFIITDDPAVSDTWAAETFDLKRRKLDKDGESLFSRLVTYTNEQPWLWAVYVIVIGLPIVLVLVFCCGSSSQDKEEQRRAAEAKKTDAVSPDDIVDQAPVKATKSKSQLEVQEEEEEEEEEEEAEASGGEVDTDALKTEEAVSEISEDAPRSPKKLASSKE